MATLELACWSDAKRVAPSCHSGSESSGSGGRRNIKSIIITCMTFPTFHTYFWMQKLLFSGLLGRQTPEATPKFYLCICNPKLPYGGTYRVQLVRPIKNNNHINSSRLVTVKRELYEQELVELCEIVFLIHWVTDGARGRAKQ
jgi:hypothetical protein